MKQVNYVGVECAEHGFHPGIEIKTESGDILFVCTQLVYGKEQTHELSEFLLALHSLLNHPAGKDAKYYPGGVVFEDGPKSEVNPPPPGGFVH